VTVEQEYPPAATERKILEKNFAELNINDSVFIERLITWAEIIRKSYADGAVDEVISTRRLVHISKAFSIFNNRLKSIEMCLNRFDTDTKTAFLDLYTKVDADATPAPAPAPAVVDWNDITIEHNQSTLSTRFSYKGESVEFSEKEMHEFHTQGLTEETIKARILDTLNKIVAAKGVK
jgi:hypothetical protein